MVSLLSLFDHLLVRLELLDTLPRSTVHALEGSILLVSPPVCARGPLNVEGLGPDVTCRLHVRAGTQIPPLIANVVDRNVLPLRNRVQKLQFIRLIELSDAPLRLRPVNHLLADGVILLDDARHLLLNLLKILLLEILAEFRQVKIVVETVLDPRPDGDLGLRVEALHSHGHHVRRTVPDLHQLLGAFIGRKLHLLLLLRRRLRGSARHPQRELAAQLVIPAERRRRRRHDRKLRPLSGARDACSRSERQRPPGHGGQEPRRGEEGRRGGERKRGSNPRHHHDCDEAARHNFTRESGEGLGNS
mmetsp:Transcript_36839/g.87093  ORF Transcript_36839/g.87093 Transcript_36839/m.87093 type:complete len:303 (-) Transcript_36839:38-946(-)